MRHLTRHSHQTLVDKITALLTADGWIGTTIEFGATAVTVEAIAPQIPKAVEPNTVAITIDHPGPVEEAEVGGMHVISYQLYVDVYGESWSVAMAICDDLRAGLTGLRMAVHDYSTGLDDPTNYLEIDDLHTDEPPAAGAVDRSTWRVVTGPVDIFFTG